jgi:transposase
VSGYSIDLRERVVKAWESGKTQGWIAETFSISVSSIKRYIKRYREKGSVAPTQQGREEPLIKEHHRGQIEAMVAQAPQAKLEQYCQMWAEQTGMQVSIQTMSRVLLRFGLPRKKDGTRSRTG